MSRRPWPLPEAYQAAASRAAGLASRLVVGVDVDERGVEPNSPLKERYEHADKELVHLRDRDRHALAILLIERRPRAKIEAGQVVAARGARLDQQRLRREALELGLLNGPHRAVLEHLNKHGEEVVESLSQLLHVGVLVGGALVAVHGDTLVHGLAVEIELLAQALHDKLLQIAAEEL